MESNLLVDIIGWSGGVEILLAYLLVSARKTEGDSVVYQLLNVAGAASLIVNSFYYGAFPSVGVNILWIGIAIYTLGKKKLHSSGN